MPVGTKIVAVKPGVIKYAEEDGVRGYGALVIVIHDSNIESYYAHLSHVAVKSGQRVAAGDLIGYSGGAKGAKGSGNSTGPHLHFELRQNGIPINPFPSDGEGHSNIPYHGDDTTDVATPTQTSDSNTSAKSVRKYRSHSRSLD